MNRGSLGILLIASALFDGCAAWQTDQPVVPSSYHSSSEQIPRTVGKLRRLVVLPLVQAAPPLCTNSDGTIRIDYEYGPYKSVADYLVDRKGYELVRLDQTRYPSWLNPSQNGPFLEEISKWSAASRELTPPGPLSQALLQRIRIDEAVDGLLLFHVHMNCYSALPGYRSVIGFMTLGMSEIFPEPADKLPYLNYRVSILETASMRPVWRNIDRHTETGKRRALTIGPDKFFVDYLFEELEPAVPRLLIR